MRVPRGGVALARVLRDEIERRGRLGRAVHGPRPGRAVRRRRQHARRAGVKLHRPEPILRAAAGPGLVRLGLPREVVHRRAVARERRDLRSGRAVERPDDAHARLDARDGEPPAHRVERDEQSLPRRTRKVRLRASLPVGNLAIVQARAAVRKLDDRAPRRAPGGLDVMRVGVGGVDRAPGAPARVAARAPRRRRRARVHPVAQRLVREPPELLRHLLAVRRRRAR